MTGPVLKVAVWIGIGAAVTGGLYWVFLITPESNTLTLAASAALLLVMVVAAAVFVNTAVLMMGGTSLRAALGPALQGLPWFVAAALPVLLTWWIVSRGDAWVARHSGEISAWFIARFGWADVSWLFTAETWVSRWLRWGIAPMTALALLASLLHTGVRGITSTGWLRRSWHWRTLFFSALVFAVLFALPWRLTAWRPELPPTWIQPTIAAARLLVVALCAVLGATLMVAVAVRNLGTLEPWHPRSESE